MQVADRNSMSLWFRPDLLGHHCSSELLDVICNLKDAVCFGDRHEQVENRGPGDASIVANASVMILKKGLASISLRRVNWLRRSFRAPAAGDHSSSECSSCWVLEEHGRR